MKRFPVLLVTHGHRRGTRIHVQEFVGNRFRAEGFQTRAIGPHLVQAVFREEHDRIIHPAPRLGTDDPDRFRDPLQGTIGRRIPADDPQGPRGGTDQGGIPAADHRGRKWPYVGRKRQLERQSPSLITDVASVVPVRVIPLPGHVDRVVKPGQAQAVPVHRPEGAVGGNRPGGRHEGFRRRRLGVRSGDTRHRDLEDVLLPRNEEPGRCRHQR
jgi:hypothetical protein